MKRPTVGSLFAGIGGLDLGFERAGFETAWQVEIDDYASAVLEKNWPHVRRWKDITNFPPEPIDDWRVDVIVGGFPCQDISLAGSGAGLEGARSGLFYELIRVVGLLQPRAVVLENVSALLARGLDRVLAELAALGFDAEWHCIPAAYVGAPHIRDRIFILAHTSQRGQSELRGSPWGNRLPAGGGQGVADSDGERLKGQQRQSRRSEQGRQANSAGGSSEGVSNADCAGSQKRENLRGDDESQQQAAVGGDREQGAGEAVESDLGGTADGFSARMDRLAGGLNAWGPDWERDVPRVAIKIPKRVDRLRCLGNAVVPQVAELVARMLLDKTFKEL